VTMCDFRLLLLPLLLFTPPSHAAAFSPSAQQAATAFRLLEISTDAGTVSATVSFSASCHL